MPRLQKERLGQRCRVKISFASCGGCWMKGLRCFPIAGTRRLSVLRWKIPSCTYTRNSAFGTTKRPRRRCSLGGSVILHSRAHHFTCGACSRWCPQTGLCRLSEARMSISAGRQCTGLHLAKTVGKSAHRRFQALLRQWLRNGADTPWRSPNADDSQRPRTGRDQPSARRC